MNKREWLGLFYNAPMLTIVVYYCIDTFKCLRYIVFDEVGNKLEDLDSSFANFPEWQLSTATCNKMLHLENTKKYEFYFVNYTNQYSKLGLLDFMAKYEKELKLYD